jgi:hypothetical protein
VYNVSGADENSDDGDGDNGVINVQGRHQARGGAKARTTSSSSKKVRVRGSPEEERHQHQHLHLDSNASSSASRAAAALQSYYVYCLHYRWLQLYSLLNSDYHAVTTTAIAPLATSDNSNAPIISILPRVQSSSRSPAEVSLCCNDSARGDAEAARITKFNFARLATAAVETPCNTTRSSSSSNKNNGMETGRGTNQQQQLMGQRSRSTAKRASRYLSIYICKSNRTTLN